MDPLQAKALSDAQKFQGSEQDFYDRHAIAWLGTLKIAMRAFKMRKPPALKNVGPRSKVIEI